MKKMMQMIMVGVISVFGASTALAESTSQHTIVKMGVIAGELTAEQPMIKSTKELSDGTIEVELSDLIIRNARGIESNWSSNVSFVVVDQYGNVNDDAQFRLDVDSFKSPQTNIKTAIDEGIVMNGNVFTIAQNHYYDTAGYMEIGFGTSLITGLNEGDQVTLSFQLNPQ